MKKLIYAALATLAVAGTVAYACGYPNQLVSCCKYNSSGGKDCVYLCTSNGTCPSGWLRSY